MRGLGAHDTDSPVHGGIRRLVDSDANNLRNFGRDVGDGRGQLSLHSARLGVDYAIDRLGALQCGDRNGLLLESIEEA